MASVTIKVILHLDDQQVVTKLTRELTTPLASILLEVLTQNGLPGGVEEWVVRFGGVWIEWEQTLGNLARSSGSVKGLALVPLEILPRSAIKQDARTIIETDEVDASVVEEPPSPSSPTVRSPTLPGTPSAPTVRDANAPTVPRGAPPPPPIPAPAPASGAAFPTLSLPPMPSMPTEQPTWKEGTLGPRPAAAARSLGAERAKVGPTAPLVERRATVRYYSRMNPERLYPILVILSKQAIQQVIKKHVEQKESAGFKVALESVVEIEPILPGCNCYPPKEYVTVKGDRVQAEFWIVPHVRGKLIKPRIAVRQDGRLLAEVPLQMKVVKQTLTLCMGLLSLLMPYVSMLLKKYQLDWEAQQGKGFPIYAWVASEVLGRMTPEIVGGVLLGLTLLLYLWFRPRQRDVFWDISEK